MNDKLQTIINQPIVYDVTEEGLSMLEEQWETVPDCHEKAAYELVRVGIREVVSLRTGIDSRRKELKADALEYSRKVDATAKEISSRVEAVEGKLKAAKQVVDDEIEAQKEAIRQAEIQRIENIRRQIVSIHNMAVLPNRYTSADVEEAFNTLTEMVISPDVFQELTEEASEAKTATLAILDNLMIEAVEFEEKERAEKIERERIEAEQKAESERLKAEREEFEAQRAKLQAEQDAEYERRKLEIRAENERMEAERAAMKAERAAMKARREELDRMMREEQSRIDAEPAEKEAARIAKEQREAEEKRIADTQKQTSDQIAIEKKLHEENHIEIASYLVTHGCTQKAASKIANALMNGNIPHMVYQPVDSDEPIPYSLTGECNV